MILFAAYQDPRPSDYVAGRTGVPAIMLPFSVGGTDQASDLISFYDDTVRRLLSGLSSHARRH